MHEVQSDFQGEQPDEGSIRIDVAAHGITDLNTQRILGEQGPTLKICSQHRVLSIALFLYQQYLQTANSNEPEGRHVQNMQLQMASSQSSGTALATPFKFLTRSVQRVHAAILKQELHKLTKGFESKSSDVAFSKVKQELQTEHDQAIQAKQKSIDALQAELKKSKDENLKINAELQQIQDENVERERKDNLNAQEKIQLILKTQLNTEIKNLEAKNEEQKNELEQLTATFSELQANFQQQQTQFLSKREQMNQQHIQNEKTVEDIINRLSGSHGSECRKNVDEKRAWRHEIDTLN